MDENRLIRVSVTILVGILFILACVCFVRAWRGEPHASLSDTPEPEGARALASLPIDPSVAGAPAELPDMEKDGPEPAEPEPAMTVAADGMIIPAGSDPLEASASSWYQQRGGQEFANEPPPSRAEPKKDEPMGGGTGGWFGGGGWFGASGGSGGTSGSSAGSNGAGSNPTVLAQSRIWASASSGGTFFGTTGGGYHANVSIGAPLSRVEGVTGSGYLFKVNIGGKGNP